MLAAGAAFAQDTGSIRGNVTDTTGAIVPGATVTLQNEATKFSRNVVTDAKGDYYFGAVSPGVYTVTVEIPGFKMSSRKGIRMSQREAARLRRRPRGRRPDRADRGHRHPRDDPDPDRRPRGPASPPSRSTTSRSSAARPLELLRILPGSVMPDVSSLESVGNTTGSSNTNQDAQYAVNGIRGSNTVVTLDGSRLADFGSNNGVIVVPNNDMVSEVKVQSSNYAAEFGSAGVQVNAITKGGSSEFHGTLYTYTAALQVPGQRPLELDHGDTTGRRASSITPAATSAARSSSRAPTSTRTATRPSSSSASRSSARTSTSAPTWPSCPTAAQRNGDFSDLLANQGSNLAQPTTVNIPGGFPGAGSAAPNNNLAPYIDPFGQMLMNLYPAENYVDPNNRYNYVFSKLEPQNRVQGVLRLDYNFTENTKMYVRLAHDSETLEKARGAWWNSSSYDLPSSLSHENSGRSISANLTSVLSPTTTNEFLFTFSKLKLDIYHTNPEAVSLDRAGLPELPGPLGPETDVAPVNLINSWSQPVGDLWDPVGEDLFAYNSLAACSPTPSPRC